MAGKFLRRPRRTLALGVGLLIAASGVVTATTVGAASAAGDKPVSVTFDNRSSIDIAACVFGSGGRCTNGGIAAGATGVVDDPFNDKERVKITVFETGTGNPRSASRTVEADEQLCAIVTDGSPLKLRVKSGDC